MLISKWKLFILIVTISVSASCSKILDEKPDKSLVVPQTIADFQAMLDMKSLMNNQSPNIGEGAADNLYLPDDLYDKEEEFSKQAYTWTLDADNSDGGWLNIYKPTNICNLAIEGLHKITPGNTEKTAWANALGGAYFFRAQAFLSGVFIYGLGYDATYADKEYGLVLRLSANFNAPSVRASLGDTYRQILFDLNSAVKYLSPHPESVFRPSKEAAYALLARTYLSMHDYKQAGLYADSSLQIKNALLDYNTLNTSSLTQFSIDNPEIIFFQRVGSYSAPTAYPIDVRVDTTLYDQYADNDIRKEAFFYPLAPGYIFKGTYSGVFYSIFTGIATDEVYLMRAECYARSGKTEAALRDLNHLLEKRWKEGAFTPLSAANAADALDLILKERRKELLFRCLRWMDIKRLNLEGRNIILKRLVHGQTYLLQPNSRHYAFPLPESIVDLYHISPNTY